MNNVNIIYLRFHLQSVIRLFFSISKLFDISVCVCLTVPKFCLLALCNL